jgi:hypothetical protein
VKNINAGVELCPNNLSGRKSSAILLALLPTVRQDNLYPSVKPYPVSVVADAAVSLTIFPGIHALPKLCMMMNFEHRETGCFYLRHYLTRVSVW